MENYTKIAVRGSAWMFFSAILTSLLGYLFRILLARQLTPGEYGLFYTLIAMFGFFSIFQNMGLNMALSKFTPEYVVKKKFSLVKSSILSVLYAQTVISLIFTVVFVILADFLAVHYFKSVDVSYLIRWYALVFFLTPTLGIFKSLFLGFKRMDLVSLVELLKIFIALVFAVFFLRYGWGVLAPIFAYLVASTIPLILLSLIFLRQVYPAFFSTKTQLSVNLYKKLFRFGIPVFLTGVAGVIFGYTDTLLITYFYSTDMTGIYNTGMPTAKVLWSFGNILLVILLPLSSELWAKKDVEKLKEGLRVLYKFVLIVTLPFLLLMVLFPEIILNVLFGDAYVVAAVVLRILAVGAIPFTIMSINNSVLSGIGKPQLVSKLMLIGVIFNIIGNVLLIPLWGMTGAAWTTLFSYVLLMVFSTRIIRKWIVFSIDLSLLVKTLLSGCFFVGVITLVKELLMMNIWIELIISVGSAGIIYILSLFLFSVVSLDELMKIFKRVW